MRMDGMRMDGMGMGSTGFGGGGVCKRVYSHLHGRNALVLGTEEEEKVAHGRVRLAASVDRVSEAHEGEHRLRDKADVRNQKVERLLAGCGTQRRCDGAAESRRQRMR